MPKTLGVYICGGCGIGESIDTQKLVRVAQKDMKAPVCRLHPFLCGAEGLGEIRADIESGGVNTVVVAACSPRVKTEAFTFDSGIVLDRVNIRELLFISEMLITFASTTMIESILIGKPIVSYNDTGAPDPLPFVRWGLGVEATTPRELQNAIRTLLHDRAIRERFSTARGEIFGDSIDGGATGRVVDLIYRLAGFEERGH